MGQSKSVKRTITKAELMRVIADDREFSVLAEGEAFVVIRWSNGEENAVFNLVQGEVTVGAPTSGAERKMNYLASRLEAEVIGDDENLPVGASGGGGAKLNVLRFAWPMLVVVLTALLIWRW